MKKKKPVAKTPATPAPKAESSAVHLPSVAKKFVPLTNADRARKRLIERHGWESDELAASFKTDEELLNYYNTIARQSFDAKLEESMGWDSEDVFDAPPDEKARLRANHRQAEKDKYTAVVQPANDQAAGPAKPAVSFDDFLKAGDDLKQLAQEIAEDDPLKD